VGLLVVALNLLLANRAASQEQVELAQVVLSLIFLHAVQHVSLTLTPISYAVEVLRQVPIRIIKLDRLSTEMGNALLVLGNFSPSQLHPLPLHLPSHPHLLLLA
jgi:hypothetical protein